MWPVFQPCIKDLFSGNTKGTVTTFTDDTSLFIFYIYFNLKEVILRSISSVEIIQYLGVTFKNENVLNTGMIIAFLDQKVNYIIKTLI